MASADFRLYAGTKKKRLGAAAARDVAHCMGWGQMQNKKWVAWALAVIVILVGGAIAFNVAGRTPAASQSGAASTPSESALSASPSAVASPGATASPRSSSSAPTSSATQPAKSPSASISASSAATASGSLAPSPTKTSASASASSVEAPKLEVPADSSTTATTLPKSVKKTPVLSGSVPKSGTAKGKLTSEFPTKALPVPSGAKIIDSSVSSQQRNIQVAVNYRSTMSVEAVLKYYEAQSGKRGWVATRGTAADGAQSITVGFGDDTMTATVRTAPTGSTIISAFGTYLVGK